jgi:hypothetical protein
MIKDPESFFRNKIESSLITASWVERLKHAIGLEAVSPVWGDQPAWYFWIEDVPGAFSLHLEHASTENRGNQEWGNGIFSIKHYPHPRQEVFKAFSFQEQCFVRSEYFDRTHTPCFEYKDKIPATLFNVATMQYRAGPDDGPALFSLESLDVMRVSCQQQSVQKYAMLGKNRAFKRGETDRTVPGWELGFTLFDRLLSLYSFYSKIKPLRVLITRSPGFEYTFDGSQKMQCVDAADLSIYSLDVLFASKKQEAADPAIKDLMNRCISCEDRQIVYDRSFLCGRYSNETNPFFLPISLNEQWWSLAESEYKSELASTCGCA